MTDQKSGFVILHYGPMSPKDMSMFAKVSGDEAVMGTDVARMAGASFAIGSQAVLDTLKERLAPAALQEAQNAYAGLSPAAVKWLATGQRGLSSEAMFSHLTGITLNEQEDDTDAHPHDPDDLRRCRLLLREVPQLEAKFDEMKHLSPEWDRLVAAWDEICDQMDEEAPEWKGSAPKTYQLMKQVLAGK